MKRLLLPLLLLTGLAANAQTRFSTNGHLDIQSQPSMGYELPAYLGAGDSMRVVSPQPNANPMHLSEQMRRNFVYVSYPAYRGQQAGKGWVLRHYLVGTLDSTLLPTATRPAETYTTTKVVTTHRYVPVTEVSRPYAAGGKVVHTVATGKATPKPRAVSSTSGPVVYYCNSGNTVKYHASPDCRGLNRCNAAVVKMSQRQAQQQMDACKFCH